MAFISKQWLLSKGISDRKHSPARVHLSARSPDAAALNVARSTAQAAAVEVILRRDGDDDDPDDPDDPEFKALYLTAEEVLTIASIGLGKLSDSQFIQTLSSLLAVRVTDS